MYLLHFVPAFQHAGHYLGVVRQGNLDRRLGLHRRGRAASLTAAAVAAGSKLHVARIWRNVPGTRERQLKRSGGLWRLCPLCNPKAATEGATR